MLMISLGVVYVVAVVFFPAAVTKLEDKKVTDNEVIYLLRALSESPLSSVLLNSRSRSFKPKDNFILFGYLVFKCNIGL